VKTCLDPLTVLTVQRRRLFSILDNTDDETDDSSEGVMKEKKAPHDGTSHLEDREIIQKSPECCGFQRWVYK
jgi:hypothetical protein